MAERVSRKRCESLKLQAKCMRAAKVQRSTLAEETAETVAEQESMPGPSGSNDSVILPAPDAEDEDLSESESDSEDYGDSADFTMEDADAVIETGWWHSTEKTKR